MSETSDRQKLISYWLSEVADVMREDDFQRDFFESLQDQFERRHDLSDKQIECLQRMYERITG